MGLKKASGASKIAGQKWRFGSGIEAKGFLDDLFGVRCIPFRVSLEPSKSWLDETFFRRMQSVASEGLQKEISAKNKNQRQLKETSNMFERPTGAFWFC